jgi:hypothetical protein
MDFWNEFLKHKTDSVSVRIDANQYTIGQPDSGFKGYGGRKFKIKFFDGRIVETECLWHNGEIPESHINLLPDNAEFIPCD